MNALKEKRIKSVIKYTWPFYIVAGIVVFIVMSILFNVAHPIPAYKSLTLFVTGEVQGRDKLSKDMFARFEENKIRNFSCIASLRTDSDYATRLKVAGYNSADVLILPNSVIEDVSNPTLFALNLSDTLINNYYQGYSFYKRDTANYGVKIDKDKVAQYMTLPDEDCYMFLNGASKNLGDYGLNPVSEHDMALQIVKDWGM